jgi:amino acid adenylation domain-containing protein
MPYLLHQLLEISAKHYPDQEAVIYKNSSISYRELDQVSNQLAHVLTSCGISRGDRVGICLDKSIEEVVAIYGILKAGAAYVPIDPSAPVKRVAFLIEDCQIKALVTTGQQLINLYQNITNNVSKYLQCAILSEEGTSEEAGEFSLTKIVTWQEVLRSPSKPLPSTNLIDSDLAHILYTSGSTGQPKGVMITHRSSLNFADCFYDCLQVQPNERISHQTPLYFGASIFDIFTSIQAGATLIIVPSELSIFPIDLAKFIEEQRINIWFSVPSLLTQLVLRGNLLDHKFSALRAIMFGGEVFPVKYLNHLMEIIPHAEYYNIFGSTETGARTYYRVKDMPPDMTSIPLGKACTNMELFVVNDEKEIVGSGEVGELYVRGSSVLKGYWGMPDKTKEVLVPYTVHSHLGEEIVFRTGDMVKQDEDGNYIYVGRRDHMIKIRGARIELAEVEKAIYGHPEIAEVVVVAIPDEQIGNRLKAFVVAKEGCNPKQSDLQYFCAERLPKYMIPESIEFRNSLPRTPTGKVERNALLQEAITQMNNKT